ncbi:hypothetical protein SAMN03159444_01927 [Pseudomonas sp. NFACC02]|nr:hypothetical protein SAMN03159444_01927 [Pseudomonas sp. NFACC02]
MGERLQLPITDGTMHVQGVTNYLHKGKYNVAGTITVEGLIDRKSYKFTYSAIGAGTWTADRKSLSISLTNMKTIPKTLNIEGLDISPQLVTKLTGQPVPTLNDAYPEGMSDEFALQSFT